ncbi:hypothetical protein DFQ30_011002 [Apophysomyces sp. BC1015]|nr:hypothetical protein DFQ30_011002 [Apophysomyces sp. BC1015]KAG0181176.1 hypothetical protein DFQ29_009136 [Apophysomyces sp. BC1021]
MNEYLPHEVLSYVAIHLSQYRLCACVLVCRSWYKAFIPALYSTVNIKNDIQLELFLEALQSQEKTNPLGRLVRKLTISEEDSALDIASLPRLCPLVAEFNYKEVWSSDFSAILQEWKYIAKFGPIVIGDPKEIISEFLQSRTTELTIHVSSYKELKDAMSELPRIEKLKIVGTYDISRTAGPEISLGEIEALHNILPRLQTFEMIYITIYGELPQHITTRDKIHMLNLCSIKGSRWGKYFGQKYTNLQELGISFGIPTDMAARPELVYLASSCLRLKRLSNYCKTGDGELEQNLWEIFQRVGAPMSELNFSLPNITKYKTIITDFHGTLSHVELNFDIRTRFEDIADPLSTCSLLVELDISLVADTEADQILDHCKHLVTLKLHSTTIYLSSDNTTANHQHGLRTLELDGQVEEAVFPYFSQRCPRLSSVTAHLPIDYRPYVIHLPKPNINKLSLHIAESAMIYKLTQLDKTKRNQKWNRKCQCSTDQDQMEDGTRWFHENDYGSVLDEFDYYDIDSQYDQQRQCYEGCMEVDFEGCNGSPEPLKSTNGKNIVWIQCHYIDEIFLNDNRVPCL